jgi:hypothetical protein
LARELNLEGENEYHAFRDALRELVHEGRVILGARGAVVRRDVSAQQAGVWVRGAD